MPDVPGVDIGDNAPLNVACWENAEPVDERPQVAGMLGVFLEQAREVKVEDPSHEPCLLNLVNPTSVGEQTNKLKLKE